mgnify:CR=1 FL=1
MKDLLRSGIMNRIKGWFKRCKEESLLELLRIILRKIASDKPRESSCVPYLPNVEYRSNDKDDPFKGNIYQLNW